MPKKLGLVVIVWIVAAPIAGAKPFGVIRSMEQGNRRGVKLWREACPIPGVYGICAHFRYSALSKRRRLVLLPRDPQRVRQAQHHFRRVLRTWGRGRMVQRLGFDRPGRGGVLLWRLRHQAARAQFMLAEIRFEDYLGLGLPKFDFSSRAARQKSLRRFRSWLRARNLAGRGLVREYGRVYKVTAVTGGVSRADPIWSIAAAARAGWVFADFASRLDEIGRPASWSASAYGAFRAGLRRFTGPLKTRAQRHFKLCRATADRLGQAANRWNQICRRELKRLGRIR